MQGDSNSSGITQMAVDEIFSLLDTYKDREFLLRCSYVEIYNEVVRDLLNTSATQQVKIREHHVRGVYLDCHEECISSSEEIVDLIALGERRRHMGVTNMNAQSSRSHTIFKIIIESRQKGGSAISTGVLCDDEADRRKSADDGGIDRAVRVASLNLVDLAGSENAKQTGAEGGRLTEAKNINKSLLTLSIVINKLAAAKGDNAHINFRDSKLTRILQVRTFLLTVSEYFVSFNTYFNNQFAFFI